MTRAEVTCAECGDWVDTTTTEVGLRMALDREGKLCDDCEEAGR